MTAFDDDLEALLDAERDIDVPAPAQRQRMFARLEPLLLVPAAVATVTTTTTVASGVMESAIRTKLIASVVSAALIGGAVGAAGHAYLAPRPAPVVPAEAAPKFAPAPTPPTTTPSEPAVREPESSAAPAATPSSLRTDGRASSAVSLRAERLLIETASAALTRGDTKSAIAALRQHARAFPKGALAEEREVLLVKALAASGDDQAAEKRAKEFKKKFPGSMQQGSVDDAARAK